MSLTEDMQKAMGEVIKEAHVENAEAADFIKDHFYKIFKHCEKTETSIKTAVTETLEGMEDGLRDRGYESKKIVQKVASGILDVTRDAAEKGISAARHTADVSKDALNKELEKVNGSIDQVKQKTKDEMKTAYGKLHEKNKTEKEHLSRMGESFKEYAEKNLMQP